MTDIELLKEMGPCEHPHPDSPSNRVLLPFLPDDCLVHILAFLDAFSVLRVGWSCRDLRRIVTNDDLSHFIWQSFLRKMRTAQPFYFDAPSILEELRSKMHDLAGTRAGEEEEDAVQEVQHAYTSQLTFSLSDVEIMARVQQKENGGVDDDQNEGEEKVVPLYLKWIRRNRKLRARLRAPYQKTLQKRVEELGAQYRASLPQFRKLSGEPCRLWWYIGFPMILLAILAADVVFLVADILWTSSSALAFVGVVISVVLVGLVLVVYLGIWAIDENVPYGVGNEFYLQGIELLAAADKNTKGMVNLVSAVKKWRPCSEYLESKRFAHGSLLGWDPVRLFVHFASGLLALIAMFLLAIFVFRALAAFVSAAIAIVVAVLVLAIASLPHAVCLLVRLFLEPCYQSHRKCGFVPSDTRGYYRNLSFVLCAIFLAVGCQVLLGGLAVAVPVSPLWYVVAVPPAIVSVFGLVLSCRNCRLQKHQGEGGSDQGDTVHTCVVCAICNLGFLWVAGSLVCIAFGVSMSANVIFGAVLAIGWIGCAALCCLGCLWFCAHVANRICNSLFIPGD